MEVINTNIAEVDGTVNSINIDVHDTDNSANDKQIEVDYNSLPQGEKDIVDAYRTWKASKIPA